MQVAVVILLVLVIVGFVFVQRDSKRRRDWHDEKLRSIDAKRARIAAKKRGRDSDNQSNSLDEQINALAEIGLPLNPGIDKADLTLSFDEEEYVAKPYDLILFAYGNEVEEEPWDRYISDSVWNLDFECIEDTGDYVRIAENMLRISQNADLFDDIQDEVDFEHKKAKLSYTLNEEEVSLTAKFNNDWADVKVVERIAHDIETHGRKNGKFWFIDNGQAIVLFFLTPEQLKDLKKLTKQKLDILLK